MEAKLVGIGYTSHERAAMFVGTILGPAFCPIIAEINAVEETKCDWPLVLSKYNAESARPQGSPSCSIDRPTGWCRPGHGRPAKDQQRGSRERAQGPSTRHVDGGMFRVPQDWALRKGLLRLAAGRHIPSWGSCPRGTQ
jgi:hypothetical protein